MDYLNSNNINKYFPHETFKNNQKEIVLDINHSFINEDKKFYILEAGTGTGKSAIAVSLAGASEDAYILTSTKLLQDQYERKYDIATIKGRNNFTCLSNQDTCDNGDCLNYVHCEYYDDCIYHNQVDNGLNENITCLNIASAYFGFRYQHFPKRDFMIIDEAHNL